MSLSRWHQDVPGVCWRLGAYSLVRGGGVWTLMRSDDGRVCHVVAEIESSRYTLPQGDEYREAREWAEGKMR